MRDKKFEFKMRSDLALYSAGEDSERVLELTITPPQVQANKKRVPLNLALVLDRSGSMAGAKLANAKAAAVYLLQNLKPDDQVAVVAYDSEVTVVNPRSAASGANLQAMIGRVNALRDGNSTNLFGGWMEGCKQVSQEDGKESLNRVLLLSDGLANVGVTNQEELAYEAHQLAKRGVSTTTFGVGLDYNEHLMESMANQGGGNFYYIEHPSQISNMFLQEFKDLASVVARDAEITLTLPEKVGLKVPGGWKVDRQGEMVRIFVGTLVAGRDQGIYIKLSFPAGLDQAALKVAARLRVMLEDNEIVELEADLDFQRADREQISPAALDEELMKRFAQVDLADVQTEALKAERAGDTMAASRQLREAVRARRPYLSKQMEDYYTDTSERMARGLDESVRKLSHAQAYAWKRGAGRDTFPLSQPDGRLVVDLFGLKVMLDSGDPISFGRLPEIEILGRTFPLSDSYQGVTVDIIGTEIGAHLDAVVGMDILKHCYCEFDPVSDIAYISRRPLRGMGEEIPLRSVLTIPVLDLIANGGKASMFIDLASKLSYLDTVRLTGLSPQGKVQDFYPGFGRFETVVYDVPIRIGLRELTLPCGILPDALAQAMKVARVEGILGAEVVRRSQVEFAFPQERIFIH